MFLKKLPWLRQLLGKCGFRRAVNFRGVVNSVGRSRMKSVDVLRTNVFIIYIRVSYIYQSYIYIKVTYIAEYHIQYIRV